MLIARIVVTVVGVAAIVWVLWYFLALPAVPPLAVAPAPEPGARGAGAA